MARISTIGADRLALRLETQSQQGRKKARQMMYAGSDILMDNLRSKIRLHGVHDTGELLDSVARTGLRVDPDSVKIDVTFTGERTRNGKRTGKSTTTRNAAIGFIQQYGRSYGKKKRTRKAGRPYFTEAVQTAKPEIIQKWTEMMHDEK